MHPNTYLKSFWRLNMLPQVFVAMSFDLEYQDRFHAVIAPAIRGLVVDGEILQPYRVDISKSGDSILTEISNGIAHSRLVLADISSMGKDSRSGHPYRNGNVLYEVGIALACRNPVDVLLVRDDHDPFLFDVSTVPHVTLDFTDTDRAVRLLSEQLQARIQEQNFVTDARIEIAFASLSPAELHWLWNMNGYGETSKWVVDAAGSIVTDATHAIDLQKLN